MAATSSPTRAQRAARSYAAAGIYIFPVWWIAESGACACHRGAACERAGKHPIVERGVLDATIDVAQIDAWWREHPDANIGVAMGRSDLYAIDDDGVRHEGEAPDAALAAAAARGGNSWPATVVSRSGSGGRHYVFRDHRAPEERAKGGVARVLKEIGIDHLDVREGNSYVVVAPSSHASGGRYEWLGVAKQSEAVERLASAELPRVPQWWLDLVEEAKAARSQHERPTQGHGGSRLALNELLADLGEGGRNEGLFRVGAKLVAHGFGRHDLEQLLTTINGAHCDPPLGADEVGQIADSAWRYAGSAQQAREIAKRREERYLADAERVVADGGLAGWHYTSSVPRLDSPAFAIHDGLPHRKKVTADGEVKFERVTSHPIYLDGETIHLQTEEQSWEVVGVVKNREIRVLAGANTILDENRIIGALGTYGLMVGTSNKRAVSNYLVELHESHPEAPRRYVTDNLGWQKIPDTGLLCWVHGTRTIVPQGETAPEISIDQRLEDAEEVERVYSSRGTMDGWLRMARRAAKYPRAAFLLLASFAPPLVKALRFELNPIIQFVTTTSSGKSTAFRVAASVWGDPSDKGQVVQGTITRPGFERLADRSRGLPIFVEEIQNFNPEVARLVYMGYANGRGIVKAAGAQGRNAAPLTASGVMFANGEGDPSLMFGNDGAAARIFKMKEGNVFGADGDDEAFKAAKTIAAEAKAHWGWAGPLWIETILGGGEEFARAVNARAAMLAEEYKAANPSMTSIAGRLLESFMRLRAIGERANETFDLGIDIETTYGAIWAEVAGAAAETTSAESFHALEGWIRGNARLFEGSGFTADEDRVEMYGRCVPIKREDGTEGEGVAVGDAALRTWAAKMGYQTAILDALVGKWKADGRIVPDGDRAKRHVRWRNGRVRMLVVPMELGRDSPEERSRE